jgi:hypothetical protein
MSASPSLFGGGDVGFSLSFEGGFELTVFDFDFAAVFSASSEDPGRHRFSWPFSDEKCPPVK